MNVYGYARVSTKTQADDGLSLDAQERQIRGYAMIHGLELAELFVERAVSGGKPLDKRPEGRRLIASVKPGDIIVCPKLDRMFRSASDALAVSDALQKRQVSLHLIDLGGDVTGNGIGKMFFTIVAAFAEFERDRIAERVSDVKRTEREKGRFLGGTRPFGYRIADGQLLPDAHEQAVVERVLVMRQRGLSLRAIAATVSAEGGRLSHVMVKRILDAQVSA